MFDAFQQYLNKAASEYNFTRQFRAVQICQEFRSLSKTLLSPEASSQSFPKSYNGKTLTIGVTNSACAQQIAMRKHEIIEAINKKYGAKTVQNIKVEMSEGLPEA